MSIKCTDWTTAIEMNEWVYLKFAPGLKNINLAVTGLQDQPLYCTIHVICIETTALLVILFTESLSCFSRSFLFPPVWHTNCISNPLINCWVTSLPNASASLHTESSWLSTKSWFSLHQRCSNMCWLWCHFLAGPCICWIFMSVVSKCHFLSCHKKTVVKMWQDVTSWIRQLRDLKIYLFYYWYRRSVCSEIALNACK